MSDDDRDQHDGHASRYPLSRLAPPFALVDVAREIEQADSMLGAVVSAELSMLADQIRELQARAHGVLERAKRDADLHRVECRFKKIPGKSYHLYERPDGARYFSQLSPDDWRGAPPHAFVATYRLEADLSFSDASVTRERTDAAELLRRLRP